MLYLVLQVGDDRFAIAASQTLEVVPLVHWKSLSRVPAEILGFFNYHGTPVPLIDLAVLICGRRSRRWMSSRIAIVRNTRGSSNGELLGLLAEQIVEIKRIDEAVFDLGHIAIAQAPYLGAIATSSDGMVQRLEVGCLLSKEVRGQLFSKTAFQSEVVKP